VRKIGSRRRGQELKAGKVSGVLEWGQELGKIESRGQGQESWGGASMRVGLGGDSKFEPRTFFLRSHGPRQGLYH